MNSLLYVNYPSWIHPEIIPGVSFLRWYGLMYVFAFAFAYLILKIQFKYNRTLKITYKKENYYYEYNEQESSGNRCR